jgi:predicted DCC family thiol-disulfide oxidoreductase YuxK
MIAKAQEPENCIVFIDGSCIFCLRFVRFVIARDYRARFLFAPLRGTTAEMFGIEQPISDARDSILVLLGTSPDALVIRQSEAILYIVRSLTWPWAMCRYWAIIPRSIRDSAYNIVAKRRHWLASRDVCPILSQKDLNRFLS